MNRLRDLACILIAGAITWHSCTTPHNTTTTHYPSKHWKVKK